MIPDTFQKDNYLQTITKIGKIRFQLIRFQYTNTGLSLVDNSRIHNSEQDIELNWYESIN